MENAMRIAIGGDHAGFDLKNTVAGWVKAMGHEVIDVGAHAYDALDDYPDFAVAVAEVVAAKKADRGIVVCGSGVGASVTANKVPGVRAGVCHDTYSAHQGVEHDDMNVLCLGGRIIGVEPTREIVAAYVNAKFVSTEAKYVRRLNKVKAVEALGASKPDNLQVLVVTFEVKPEHRQAFYEAALEDARNTKAHEPGCLRFDVVEDTQNPNRFVFFEVYRDADALKAHTQAPYLAKWVEATKPMVLQRQLVRGRTVPQPK
jgi:ribose 5-phosphate isomerase B